MARFFAPLLTLVLLPGCNFFLPWDACRVDADCDDGDACTVDECRMRTGLCTNDPVDCTSGQECDSDTGLCVGPNGEDEPTGSPELKRFESQDDLASYFASQITGRNTDFFALEEVARPPTPGPEFDDESVADGTTQDGGAAPSDGGGADDESSDADSFSETTIQEEGVDEADVVKTDGTYLYVIHESVLRIVRVSPPEEMALISQVSLEGFGREIYLHAGRVIALTETYGGYFYIDDGGLPEPGIMEVGEDREGILGPAIPGILGPAMPGILGPAIPGIMDFVDPITAFMEEALGGVGVVASEPQVLFERPQTIVTVIDAATPDEPRILTQTAFDGSRASSRMIDGVLHLVLANYQDYYYDVMPMLGQRQLDLSEVDVESLLPHYETNDEQGVASDGAVLTWENMFRPTDPDGFGVVTVVSMDIDSPSEFTAVGIVAEPGLIYSSREALYLTDADYGFSSGSRASRQTTDIYKLQYVEDGATPVATGTVPGRILNQYSMGEYNGYLRVATTVDAAFFGDFDRSGPYNNIYVLGQDATSLEIVGSIEKIALGEEIKSARFIGERGYLVTFERIDPLHTLDLADPTDPRVVGTLHVPGFSTFIVPMDSDHLLTLGQYIPEDDPFGPWGVQLSIFDISNFSEPVLADNVIIGGDAGAYTEAYSEALGNPKAFTYFAGEGLVALPISIYTYGAFIDDIFFDPGIEEILDESSDAVGGETGDADGSEGGGEVDPDEPDGSDVPASEPPEMEEFDGLIVFRVSGEEGFSELGRISTRFDQTSYFWTAFTRGVFIGDDVFAVTNEGVRGAPVDDIASTPYELSFGSEEPAGGGGSTSPGGSDAAAPIR